MALGVLFVLLAGVSTGIIVNTEYSPQIDTYVNEKILHNTDQE